MPVDYSNLWKLLIDKKMNKSQLKCAASISTNAVAKMGRNEAISLDTLEKICLVLNCGIEDVIQFTHLVDGSKSKAIAKSGTFALNKDEPFHRWYSYIEGYSSCLVTEELNKLVNQGCIINTIYDPFGGTGTTGLVACTKGIKPYYSESNPFMQQVIETKINISRKIGEKKSISELRNIANSISSIRIKHFNTWDGFEKYFYTKQLDSILSIKSHIHNNIEDTELKKILMLALSSIIVKSSKMIRRGDLRYATEKEYTNEDVIALFSTKLTEIIDDLEKTSLSLPYDITLVSEDARDNNEKDLFDCVITSPPYLNGTNYIRNTKLELKLNDYIKTEKDLPIFHSKGIVAGINNVSKRMGTKPILSVAKPFVSELMKNAYDDRIPKMVAAYFYDMHDVIEKLSLSMRSGGYFIMDIGDSQFGGVHIPTHSILSDICEECSFNKTSEDILRKRRSKNGMILTQRIMRFRLEK